MTPIVDLVSSSLDSGSRRCGRCVFVLAPSGIELAAASIRLRNSASRCGHRRFEPAIVDDPSTGVTPMPSV